MNQNDPIPIRNLYYLLIYSWNRLAEASLVKVSTEESTNLLDLFARVLENGTRRLLKKGLDRAYLCHQEDLRGIRGRVNFAESLQRNLLRNALVCCDFDDLSYNILHNRILKTTIAYLAGCKSVDPVLREKMVGLKHRLRDIDIVEISPGIFSRVRIHRNNAFYGFLMNICEFIFKNSLVSEEEGREDFQSFIRDRAQMAAVFESFILNFYRIELEGVFEGYKVVGEEIIRWDAECEDRDGRSFLPLMKTDISMETPTGYLIIDTKYYFETLSGQYGQKVRSEHLYQLFSYVRNIKAKGREFHNCSGILLYPTVKTPVHLDYDIQGHRLSVRTIDLTQNWRNIYLDLLEFVGAGNRAEKFLQTARTPSTVSVLAPQFSSTFPESRNGRP